MAAFSPNSAFPNSDFTFEIKDLELRLVKNQTSSPRQSEHPGTRPALAQGPGEVTQRVHDLREGRLLMPNLFLKKYDQ